MASTSLLFIAALATVWTLGSGCPQSCPPGYKAYTKDAASCTYLCGRKSCSSSAMYYCGGTSPVKCGPATCSSNSPDCGSTTIRVVSNASSASVIKVNFQKSFVSEKEICAKHASPVTNAVRSANAYAIAVAKTSVSYTSFACQCYTNAKSSAITTTFNASLRATAQAYATGLADALATLSCYGDIIAGASGAVGALAEDTQFAMSDVYYKNVTTGVPGCTSVTNNKVVTSIARAIVCPFIQLYVAYDLANDDGTAISCSSTVVVTGLGPQFTCPTVPCDAPPLKHRKLRAF